MSIFFFAFLSVWTVSWLEIISKKIWVAKWLARGIPSSGARKCTLLRLLCGAIIGTTLATLYSSLGAAVAFSALAWLTVLVWETDLKTMKIPSEPVWFVFLLGVAGGVLTFNLEAGIMFLVGLVMLTAVFVLTALLTKGGLGSGDVRLIIAFSPIIFWSGILSVFLGVLLGVLLQATVRLFLLLMRKNRKFLPLAPTLTFGMFVAATASGFLSYVGMDSLGY